MWLVNIIEVYVIAILLLIHCSLLFCTPKTCSFDSTPLLQMIPSNTISFIQKMISIIPISMENLQIIAHFLLIGDFILIITCTCKIVGSIFKSLLTSIVLTLFISFAIYLLTQNAVY